MNTQRFNVLTQLSNRDCVRDVRHWLSWSQAWHRHSRNSSLSVNDGVIVSALLVR